MNLQRGWEKDLASSGREQYEFYYAQHLDWCARWNCARNSYVKSDFHLSKIEIYLNEQFGKSIFGFNLRRGRGIFTFWNNFIGAAEVNSFLWSEMRKGCEIQLKGMDWHWCEWGRVIYGCIWLVFRVSDPSRWRLKVDEMTSLLLSWGVASSRLWKQFSIELLATTVVTSFPSFPIEKTISDELAKFSI
jgi:hypothetical protein